MEAASRTNATGRKFVVLPDLADRTEAHTGCIILVAPELDAVAAVYNALGWETIDLAELPTMLQRQLRRDGKIGVSAIVDDVENMLCYLAIHGRITLPGGKIGRHRAEL